MPIADSRIFFATKPPPELVEELKWLRLHLGLRAHYPAEHFHITLQLLGSGNQLGAGGLETALAAAEAMRFASVRTVFEYVAAGKLLGIEPIARLIAFQRALVQALAYAGLDLPAYPFRPHLSLSYKDASSPCWHIDPISWRVEDFLLIQSFRGQGRHEVLGRWRLSIE